VKRAIVGDKADLGARVARDLVQVLEHCLAEGLQVAGGDGVVRDVEEVEVHGWRRRAQGVLGGRDELDRGRVDLWPLGGVAVAARDRVE